ncbi:hypothetical protein GF318_04975 [Candidatus Micrarchaeota archaeon]|nr:hypothetical protein [Candidatus Micrarchaeota archaeon]
MTDFGSLINIYKPKELANYLRRECQKAGWGPTAINVAIAIIVTSVASAVVALVGTMLSGVLGAMGGDLGGAAIGGAFNFVLIAATAVASFIGFFVVGLILHFIAAALGGKGTPEKTLYMMSLPMLALSPLYAVITLLSVIPCVGCLLIPVGLLVAIYQLFVYYKGLMAVNGMESTKAIIALVAWVILLLILYAIVFGLMFALGVVGGMGAGMLGSNF